LLGNEGLVDAFSATVLPPHDAWHAELGAVQLGGLEEVFESHAT
jgi:hypothetical protein